MPCICSWNYPMVSSKEHKSMAACVSRVSTWHHANPASEQDSVKWKQLHVDSFDRRRHIQITVSSKISCQIINLKAQFLPSRSLAELSHLLTLIPLLPLAPYHNTRDSESPCQGETRKAEGSQAGFCSFEVSGGPWLFTWLSEQLTHV